MNHTLIINFLRFILLTLLQVLVFNNMDLGGYLTPAVYVLFILLLPETINKSLLLLLGFFTGLTIDIFLNTPGLHAGATVLMAFARPGVLRLFFRNLEFSTGEAPGLVKLGISGFIRYALVLIFIQHLALFLLESFSFQHFGQTLYRTFLSSLLTLLIILIVVLSTTTRKK
jgi:rod shape-determining protein MreD